MSNGMFQVDLPSKCLPYPGVDPKGIHLKLMTGKEEELVASMNAINLKVKLAMLLESVVTGVDVKLLTAGDIQYILLWLAMNCYTSKYPIRLTCSNCLMKSDIVVDLSTIPITELPSDFTQPQEVPLPISNTRVKLRLLNLGDEMRIMTTQAQETEVPTYLLSIAHSIVDENKGPGKLAEDLAGLPTKDLAVIRQWTKHYDHGPTMQAPYTCPKCGFVGSTEVPFRFDTILQVTAESPLSV